MSDNPNSSVDEIDVLVPVGPRDVETAALCVRSVQRHVAGIRRIHVVSRQDPGIEGVTWWGEDIFPFTLADVSRFIGDEGRSGWYFQQLTKLCFQQAAPEISDRLLVVDSDVLFLRRCVFHEGGRPVFNFGSEFHQPYFDHMQRLHPSLIRMFYYSGISHGMPLTRAWVAELISLVQTHQRMPFWQVFLAAVDPAHRSLSGASEYELYFHYCLQTHAQELTLRRLDWRNVRGPEDLSGQPDFVALHWYLRQGPIDQALWRGLIDGDR